MVTALPAVAFQHTVDEMLRMGILSRFGGDQCDPTFPSPIFFRFWNRGKGFGIGNEGCRGG
jgi:hypothetical protein